MFYDVEGICWIGLEWKEMKEFVIWSHDSTGKFIDLFHESCALIGRFSLSVWV